MKAAAPDTPRRIIHVNAIEAEVIDGAYGAAP